MPAGRPKAVINYDQAEELGSIMCSQAECAAVLGVSEALLTHDSEFRRRHWIGKHRGCAGLRRKQFKKAMAGNVTMLTWLGKNYLEQSDKKSVQHEGTVNFATLSRAELERIVRGHTIDGMAVTEHELIGTDSLNGTHGTESNGTEPTTSLTGTPTPESSSPNTKVLPPPLNPCPTADSEASQPTDSGDKSPEAQGYFPENSASRCCDGTEATELQDTVDDP